MPKLPIISGRKAVKAFRKLGYKVTRRKSSHIRMWHSFNKDKKPLTIPQHKILGKGLLRRLLRDADISVEDFLNLLK